MFGLWVAVVAVVLPCVAAENSVVYAGFNHVIVIDSTTLESTAFDYRRDLPHGSSCDAISTPPLVDRAPLEDWLSKATRESHGPSHIAFSYLGYEMFLTTDKSTGSYVVRRCRDFRPQLAALPCEVFATGAATQLKGTTQVVNIGNNRIMIVDTSASTFAVYHFDADVHSGGDPFGFNASPLVFGQFPIALHPDSTAAYFQFKEHRGDGLVIAESDSATVLHFNAIGKNVHDMKFVVLGKREVAPHQHVVMVGENEVLFYNTDLDFDVWALDMNSASELVISPHHAGRLGAGVSCIKENATSCVMTDGCAWCPSTSSCHNFDLAQGHFCNDHVCEAEVVTDVHRAVLEDAVPECDDGTNPNEIVLTDPEHSKLTGLLRLPPSYRNGLGDHSASEASPIHPALDGELGDEVDVDALFDMLDGDANKKVDYKEFVLALSPTFYAAPPPIADWRLAMLKSMFSNADTDGNQLIDATEVSGILTQLGYLGGPARVELLVSLVDMNGDGLISFEQFTSGLEKLMKSGQLQIELHRANHEGHGFVTKSEASRALEVVAGFLTPEHAVSLVEKFDVNHNGKIPTTAFILEIGSLLTSTGSAEPSAPVRSLYSAFAAVDHDSLGTLNATQVSQLLQHLQVPHPAIALAVMVLGDSAHKGLTPTNLVLALQKLMKEGQLTRTLEAMDIDHRGFLSKNDLLQAFYMVGVTLTPSETGEFVGYLDQSHDDHLLYRELIVDLDLLLGSKLPPLQVPKPALQVGAIGNIFNALDANRNGALDHQEVEAALRMLGTCDDCTDQALIFTSLADTNQNGLIEFNEFANVLAKMMTAGRLQAMFEALDKNHDGFLSREEFKNVMHVLGSSLTEAQEDGVFNNHISGSSKRDPKLQGALIHEASKLAQGYAFLPPPPAIGADCMDAGYNAGTAADHQVAATTEEMNGKPIPQPKLVETSPIGDAHSAASPDCDDAADSDTFPKFVPLSFPSALQPENYLPESVTSKREEDLMNSELTPESALHPQTTKPALPVDNQLTDLKDPNAGMTFKPKEPHNKNQRISPPHPILRETETKKSGSELMNTGLRTVSLADPDCADSFGTDGHSEPTFNSAMTHSARPGKMPRSLEDQLKLFSEGGDTPYDFMAPVPPEEHLDDAPPATISSLPLPAKPEPSTIILSHEYPHFPSAEEMENNHGN